MDINNFDKETAKRYSAEGLDGLVKTVKESLLVKNLMEFDKEDVEAVFPLILLADCELRKRFNVVAIDITMNAIIKALLSDEHPERKETDAMQKAVDYFKESKYYKAWLEADTGTEGGLTGAVLITYALDSKFNELCRKAGLNSSSAVARVIVTRLMEQKYE